LPSPLKCPAAAGRPPCVFWKSVHSPVTSKRPPHRQREVRGRDRPAALHRQELIREQSPIRRLRKTGRCKSAASGAKGRTGGLYRNNRGEDRAARGGSAKRWLPFPERGRPPESPPRHTEPPHPFVGCGVIGSPARRGRGEASRRAACVERRREGTTAEPSTDPATAPERGVCAGKAFPDISHPSHGRRPRRKLRADYNRTPAGSSHRLCLRPCEGPCVLVSLETLQHIQDKDEV